ALAPEFAAQTDGYLVRADDVGNTAADCPTPFGSFLLLAPEITAASEEFEQDLPQDFAVWEPMHLRETPPTVVLCGSLCGSPYPADLNCDGAVNGTDLGLLLGGWGGNGVGDVNNDGVVNATDLGILLGSWTG